MTTDIQPFNISITEKFDCLSNSSKFLMVTTAKQKKARFPVFSADFKYFLLTTGSRGDLASDQRITVIVSSSDVELTWQYDSLWKRKIFVETRTIWATILAHAFLAAALWGLSWESYSVISLYRVRRSNLEKVDYVCVYARMSKNSATVSTKSPNEIVPCASWKRLSWCTLDC